MMTKMVETGSGEIAVHINGTGPVILCVHGWPEHSSSWRHQSAYFAKQGYTVAAMDVRGYGDSGKPASDPEHRPYSKRVMARDQIALMAALGHDRFSVVGHDRGGRVAHRLALDFPDAVERLAVLDIAPTRTMYAGLVFPRNPPCAYAALRQPGR